MHKWLLSFRARMAGLLAWVPRPVRRLLLWTVVAVPAALLVFTLAMMGLAILRFRKRLD